MIEMAKVRNEYLFVAFFDLEKAYDIVDRRKLFEVMRGYGVQEILVNVIERIYNRVCESAKISAGPGVLQK